MGLVDDEELVETDEEDDDEYGKKPRWDCESILSTLSNKRNHPVVIRDECASVKANRRKVRQRQALPLGEADEEEDEVENTVRTRDLIKEFFEKNFAQLLFFYAAHSGTLNYILDWFFGFWFMWQNFKT